MISNIIQQAHKSLQPDTTARQISCAASLHGNCKTPNKNTHSMYVGDCGNCDAAIIAKVAAAVTHVQSQSQEISSGDEGLGLLCFDLSSAETDFG